MKLISSSFAILLTLAAAAHVQAGAQQTSDTGTQTSAPVAHKQGRHGAGHRAQMLAQKLNLTPDQTAQIEPIFASQREQMRALRTGTTDPASVGEQRRAIARDTHQKLMAVLTPEQRDQYKALRESRHHHRPADTAAPQSTAPGI